MKFYIDILSNNQKEILEKVSFLNKFRFYLGGGTALALQLGHRTSIDFDFYTPKKIRYELIASEFNKQFKNIEVIQASENDIKLFIKNTSLTAFYYPYPLIRKPNKLKNVSLASIEDIAAMKIVAILQRGRKRDFIDIYYLLKKFSLPEILKLTEEKYPEFEILAGLKALIYFTDADNEADEGRIRLKDHKISWPKVKKCILLEVQYFAKNLKLDI